MGFSIILDYTIPSIHDEHWKSTGNLYQEILELEAAAAVKDSRLRVTSELENTDPENELTIQNRTV